MKQILSLLYFLFAGALYAQKAANIWYFGTKAGLDFNTVPPSPLVGSMSTSEGCSSIADPVTGKLLFYTDGV